jgi:flagellar motor protein MotB
MKNLPMVNNKQQEQEQQQGQEQERDQERDKVQEQEQEQDQDQEQEQEPKQEQDQEQHQGQEQEQEPEQEQEQDQEQKQWSTWEQEQWDDPLYWTECATAGCGEDVFRKHYNQLNPDSTRDNSLFYCTVHLADAREIYREYKRREKNLFVRRDYGTFVFYTRGDDPSDQQIREWITRTCATHDGSRANIQQLISTCLRICASLRAGLQNGLREEVADFNHSIIPLRLLMLAVRIDYLAEPEE